jgi:glyoxylase I family protein
MTIDTSSTAHVRLTVTNIERARHHYQSVSGRLALIEAPESADVATREALTTSAVR